MIRIKTFKQSVNLTNMLNIVRQCPLLSLAPDINLRENCTDAIRVEHEKCLAHLSSATLKIRLEKRTDCLSIPSQRTPFGAL